MMSSNENYAQPQKFHQGPTSIPIVAATTCRSVKQSGGVLFIGSFHNFHTVTFILLLCHFYFTSHDC